MAEKRPKMTRSERARQFAPFAALRGFEDMIREVERTVKEPKRELTEERAAALSRTVSALKKGDMVRVKYYENEGYTVKEGAVSGIDPALKKLTVVKTRISFEDIYELEAINER